MSHSTACPGKLKLGLRHDHPDQCHTYRGTTGWIEGPIKAPKTGGYELLIEAAGTKAADEYPKVAVSLDGKRLSTIQLTSDRWQYYTVQAQIAAGGHKLRLQFTNDYYKPPEDRNLKLGRLVIVPTK
jgi:hypothetical protein